MGLNSNFLSKQQIQALHNDQQFREYQAALHLWWQGEESRSLAHLSETLTKSSEHRFAVQLYRLWVEILADAGDKASLHLLQGHLQQLDHHDQALGDDYFGLRALIHLELDEWEAVELLYPMAAELPRSRYCLEFCLRYSLRRGGQLGGQASALQLRNPVDYFQWEKLCGILQSLEAPRQVENTLAFISQLFPLSPLPSLWQANQCIARGQLDQAKTHSSWLRQQYPHQLDYVVLHAYIQLNRGEVTATVRMLESLLKNTSMAADPDIFTLLGNAYLQRAQSTQDQGFMKQARTYLDKAEAAYHRMGISCPQLRLALQEQQVLPAAKTDNLLQFAVAGRSISTWMVQVSHEGFNALLSESSEKITHLVQDLTSAAKTNDLVFFASQHPWNATERRILAFYQVVGKAGWQKGKDNLYNLKLIKRFKEPLGIAFAGESLQALVSIAEGETFRGPQGVYQLSQLQLGQLSGEIQELTLDRTSMQRWAKSS